MTSPLPLDAGVRGWAFELPWDKLPLSLNRQMHWSKQRQIERQIMDDTQWLARHHKVEKGLRHVRIELHWFPSVTRRRDTDNPAPTLKKIIDGLVKHGLVEDDTHRYVSSEVIIHEPLTGSRPKFFVKITEVVN